jgi:Outer membrane receptor for ferrienterochelin and colicins
MRSFFTTLINETGTRPFLPKWPKGIFMNMYHYPWLALKQIVMKYFIFIIASLFFYASVYAQDSTASFKVYGNCEQCKARIETAVHVKGVIKADWDIDTKMLSVSYNPAIISLEAIHQKIANAGHDTELKKAKDEVYNALPACCKYRKKSTDKAFVKGMVLEEDKKGNFKPLAGASVVWYHSNTGAITDNTGMFNISRVAENEKLVVSYVGFASDTILVADKDELKIILASNKQLNDVTVTAMNRGLYSSMYMPIKTTVFGEKELLKAACCNLSESFETNPSVDVSYSDAISGSKQIQLLGLSGIYTQLTVENMPGPRGIATANGLNLIPGTWIEGIQLTKGTGSVANGYESIAGQINIEEKKPENSEKLYANVYVNNFGKNDVNLNLSQKINNKWSTALLLHNDLLGKQKMDENNDGFRDMPYGNLFTVMNRWKYNDNKGFMLQFGARLLTDDKTGGENNFNPSTDELTTNRYGFNMKTQRYEGFAKIGYVFPQKKYKSIGLQLSSFSHTQNNYFGLTTYNAKQHNFYGNLIYQSIIKTTANKFRAGVSFLYDDYNETLNVLNVTRKETVPGAFVEYTYMPNEKFTMVAGARVDNNNLFGTFVTPRLNVRYAPVKNTTIRLSAGRGERTANPVAENMSVLASARQIILPSNYTGSSYPFNAEIAWNEGLTIDQQFKLFNRGASFSVDFFRTDFTQQVIVDEDLSARQAVFSNLNGKSYSNALQAELDVKPVSGLDVRMAYRWYDVKTSYHNELLQKPLVAKDRAFITLDYETHNKWKFDVTGNWVGTKRLPYTGDNPAQFQLGNYSPSYFLMNAQVSKSWKIFDAYIGCENVTGYRQDNLIIDAAHPFGNYFDASMVWGPAIGRMVYVGLRYKLM